MALIYRTMATVDVYAVSGRAIDIQQAVNEAALSGMANVHIPEGTFNFVEVGEPWMTVNIPAGINVFGASTARTSGLPVPERGMNPNDQVVEWKTVLIMPYDPLNNDPAHTTTTWFFNIQGNGDPNKPSRVSDIKFVGYRDLEPTNVSWHGGVQINNVIDYRVDHCFFKHCTGGGVYTSAPANGDSNGVIDHNKFINTYAYLEWNWLNCTVAYGVMTRAVGTTRWEDNIDNVLGKYLGYTMVVEDNYFSRWRHSIASNDGTHYIFRYNTVEKDAHLSSIDAHGTYDYVGTRAWEVYNNELIDPVIATSYDSMTPSNGQQGYGLGMRGGGGVVFNNLIRNYAVAVYLSDEGTVEKCWIHDVYLWNNTRINDRYAYPLTYSAYRTIQENVDYFLYEKPNYTPYIYPHPLTLAEMPQLPTTPWLDTLGEGSYKVTMPSNVISNGQNYNFVQWEDGSTNPTRTINLTSDTSLLATYEATPPQPNNTALILLGIAGLAILLGA